MNKKTVFVAMSGGVDSSVAAALLKRQGFDVIGVFMKNWTGPSCTAAEDFESAACAARTIGMPLYAWNFEDAYRKKVFDYMISEYGVGHTPNPDVMCNKEIKFGVFFANAMMAGADIVATGHYARVKNVRGLHKLLAGIDKNKDQSYFLWTLTQDKLAKTLFPVGDYTKPQVRKLAKKFGLPNAYRPDSQGLCFVGNVDFQDFLHGYMPEKRGQVLDVCGKVLGEHSGVHYYTIGQRHGIGIGGGKPYYVVAKDVERNTLTVAAGDASALYETEFFVTDINWIAGQEPLFPLRCTARIRYRQPLQECVITKDASGTGLHVVLDQPQRAVTPGQSAVFYLGEEVMGGGIIMLK